MKNHRKSDAVELERKAANGESEEVARWSSMERWWLGVAWPESDSRALNASSAGMLQRWEVALRRRGGNGGMQYGEEGR
jgi:hypothetical protein